MFDHNEVVINDHDEIGPPSYLSFGRVVVPEFEIVRNPTIRISDVKSRRFSLIDRYK
jgi:hypothetical protein